MEMGTGAHGVRPTPGGGSDTSFSSSCVALVVVAMEGEASLQMIYEILPAASWSYCGMMMIIPGS